MGLFDRLFRKKKNPKPFKLSEINIPANMPALNAAANLFIQNFGPAFTNTPGGHIQTDIAGAASVAGLMLLRLTRIEINGLKTGDVVLAQEISDANDELFKFMVGVSLSLGLDPKFTYSAVSKENEALMKTEEMSRKLEKSLKDACSKSGLDMEYYPCVAALTAMKLVSAGKETKLLDENSGKNLAFYYTIAGSKTVPYSP